MIDPSIQPLTAMLIDGMNEARMQGALIGVVIPRNIKEVISKENPEWNLDDKKKFRLNDVPFKVVDKDSDVMYFENSDARPKLFNSFKP